MIHFPTSPYLYNILLSLPSLLVLLINCFPPYLSLFPTHTHECLSYHALRGTPHVLMYTRTRATTAADGGPHGQNIIPTEGHMRWVLRNRKTELSLSLGFWVLIYVSPVSFRSCASCILYCFVLFALPCRSLSYLNSRSPYFTFFLKLLITV